MNTTRDLELAGAVLRLERRDQDDGFTLTHGPLGGEAREELAGTLLRASPGWVTLRIGGRTRRVRLLRRGDELFVAVGGETYRFTTPRRGRGGAGGSDCGRIESPMPGSVLEVLVADGDAVEQDQDLLVVEAMKMEHRLKAPRSGVVRGLGVAAGDQVGAGQLLLEVQAE